MADHAFTIYVTGDTTRSRRAVRELRRLCERHVPGDFELTVVDVLREPQAAEDANIVATPTVVRTRPGPPARALGDLAEPERVAAALGLDTSPERPDPPLSPLATTAEGGHVHDR